MENDKVIDLRKPQQKEPTTPATKPTVAKVPLADDVASIEALAISPDEQQRFAELARRPEENIVWPTPNPNAPLLPYLQRRMYYLNQYGRKVVLDEENAYRLHNRMKEFHGDHLGNMTPPRFFKKDVRKGLYGTGRFEN